MNNLTKPGFFTLFLFGLFTVTAILYVFYRFALPFFSLFSYAVFIYVGIPLILFLVATILIDVKFKTKFKSYGIVALVLFICCLLLFPKVKSFIEEDTEIRGQKLVEAIQRYKEKKGFWPQSLDDPYFNNCSKTAIVQRPFYYRLQKVVDGDTSFIFYFYSFEGLEASLIINSTKLKVKPIVWNYSD